MAENAFQAKLKELDELQDKLSKEEFLEKVQTELKPLWMQELMAHGAQEPDWAPLYKVLPTCWCDGFCFMGYEGAIRVYKNGFTRACLYIDPAGNTYERHEHTFRPIPMEFAIERVFDGIEELGFKRTSPYNKKNAAKRRKKLEKQGWTIVSLGGDPPE